MKRTFVKIVAVHENPDTPCWPCENHDHKKELDRVLQVVYARNPDMDFDLVEVTSREQVQDTYEEDLKKYDGVLVLLLTCWKGVDLFYAAQSADGLPAIIADVPYCGSGSVLRISRDVQREGWAAVVLSTLDYGEIADAVRLFDVIAKMKQTVILDVTNRAERNRVPYEQFRRDWGCTFIQKSGAEMMEAFNRVPEQDAAAIADRWVKEAAEVVEPTRQDLLDSAKLHLALKEMMRETGADAVTVDCLSLSYSDDYGKNKKMYPCLSHYEMLNHGQVAVCESDLNATITSLVVRYLTDRPGFVSDPVIDTSSNQIIYAHCVACTKVYGFSDPRTCRFAIRSHAEDKKGAAVQVYFPANEAVTTLMIYPKEMPSVIHSGRSVGNVGLQEACRSKLAAETDAEAILTKWTGGWHRVTVFGDVRKKVFALFRLKGISCIEEDKI